MVTQKLIVKNLGGTVTKAAAALGCSRQALYNWGKVGGRVPELYVYRYRSILAAQDRPSGTKFQKPTRKAG